MNVTRYTGFLFSLITALLFSVVVPCGLFNAEADACTPTEHTPADGAAGDKHAGDVHLCCAACLTCCTSYTTPPGWRPLAPTSTAVPHARPPAQGPPPGSPLSIWRPPRI